MDGTHYGIDAVVKIEPTFVEAFSNANTPPSVAVANDLLQRFGGAKLRDDLISVTVSNSIRQPFATFQLVLSPLPIAGPFTWADLIRPYSLVAIALHRLGTSGDPAATDVPDPVLLGLVDYAAITEDYSTAEPRRIVRVVGRSLSAVLSDQRWWYHHFLSQNPPPDLREFYEQPPGIVLLRDEVQLRSLGIFATDLDRFKDVTQRHPVDCMEKAYELFVGSGSAPGFIKLLFADGRTLGDRLRFDAVAARVNFPDPNARLTGQFIPTTMPEASCWQVMDHFKPEDFAEFFTDCVGTSVEDVQCQIIARKPPWAGHIAYGPKGASLAFSPPLAISPAAGFGSGFSVAFNAPGPGTSLFDGVFGSWNRDEQTVAIDGSDVISQPVLRRGLDARELMNVFEVRPQIGDASGNTKGDNLAQQEFPPLVDEEPASPSYIRRYGIRKKTIQLNSIPIFTADGSTRLGVGDPVRHCLAYAALLRHWHRFGPEFWSGTRVLKGRTALRAGRRLYDVDQRREFYITAVSHHMQLDVPGFTSTVQLERGWDLQ